MYGKVQGFLQARIDEIKNAGLYKSERVITGPQQARVTVSGGGQVLNLCANNYLGLANHPAVREAAQQALQEQMNRRQSTRRIVRDSRSGYSPRTDSLWLRLKLVGWRPPILIAILQLSGRRISVSWEPSWV